MSSVPDSLGQTLSERTDAEVRFRRADKILYSTDASNYRVEPLGVVIPRTTGDICETVKTAREFGVPILPRGGGTGLAGQCLGSGITVDMSKHMDGVLEIDTERKTASVQPGICLGRLNGIAGEKGLMFGPDPASAKVATVGGIVASNGTGAHSILYGMAGDNVVSLKAVIHSGKEVSFSSSGCSDEDISRALEDFRNANRKTVSEKFPSHWRRASGYSLNYLLDDRFNPAKLFAASEGTFGIATELTLRLVEKPAHKGLAVLQFDSLARAVESVPQILENQPSAIELIDGMLIGLTRRHGGFSHLLSFVRGCPQAVLAVEFFGKTPGECRAKAEELVRSLNERGVACEKGLALEKWEQEKVWGVRTAGLGLLMSSRSRAKPIPCIEDVSVPPVFLAEYVSEVSDVFSSLGLKAGFYAHASAGCLHIRPLIDLSSRKGAELMEEVSDAALGLALKYGGVMSGEHGDGLQRSHLNRRLFGDEIYAAMEDLKKLFDPENRFNPGKVVNPVYGVKDNLRARGERKSAVVPLLNWDSSGGMVSAAGSCNGQGLCRKIGDGAMCPSFMATRDETHTTRGRANLLRNVLSGNIEEDFLLGSEAEEVFDLCIGCKACKAECPSAVDAAKMKTEFLARRGISLGFSPADGIFAGIHKISSAMSRAPAATNFIARSAFSKKLLEFAAGIDPRRSFPRMSSERFSDWFSRRGGSVPKEKKAVYFHDTWAEFFNPEAGRGAVRILETLGYEVVVERRRVCCGRPMISRGMIDKARENALVNISLLYPHASRGIPIIGTEPSCASMFGDDYADILPRDEKQKTVSRMFFTLEKFVKSESALLAEKISPPADRVLTHTHCHQKAAEPDWGLHSVLTVLGFDAVDSGAGCCGMAGGFGYEKKHYEVSAKIAADRLLPGIEKLESPAKVCVTGISCMEQIRHFSDAKPAHFAELVANCLAG